MGLRFRKSIRLFPGLRLNLSKGGVSASLGSPGATVNVSRRGVRGTVGVPGSGLSYSEDLPFPEADRPDPALPAPVEDAAPSIAEAPAHARGHAVGAFLRGLLGGLRGR